MIAPHPSGAWRPLEAHPSAGAFSTITDHTNLLHMATTTHSPSNKKDHSKTFGNNHTFHSVTIGSSFPQALAGVKRGYNGTADHPHTSLQLLHILHRPPSITRAREVPILQFGVPECSSTSRSSGQDTRERCSGDQSSQYICLLH